MTSGYIRQSSANIQPNLNINAGDLNAEFNTLASAFDSSTGHDHSGSVSGDGQKIPLASAVSGTLPVANGGTGLTTSPITKALGGTGVTDGSNLLPPGVLMAYSGGASPPTGWLVCNGGAVSRTTYAALFAVISTSYGAGDGSTTFNVPDCRGYTIAGYDPSNATGRLNNGTISAASIGNTGGEQVHTMTQSELVAHTHGISDPTHTHTTVTPTNNTGAFGSGNNPPATSNSVTVNNNFSSTTGPSGTGITIGATGSTTPFNVVQPTIIFLYIIKT